MRQKYSTTSYSYRRCRFLWCLAYGASRMKAYRIAFLGTP